MRRGAGGNSDVEPGQPDRTQSSLLLTVNGIAHRKSRLGIKIPRQSKIEASGLF